MLTRASNNMEYGQLACFCLRVHYPIPCNNNQHDVKIKYQFSTFSHSLILPFPAVSHRLLTLLAVKHLHFNLDLVYSLFPTSLIFFHFPTLYPHFQYSPFFAFHYYTAFLLCFASRPTNLSHQFFWWGIGYYVIIFRAITRMLRYSDFQEEFVKHYYKKIHNKQRTLSLDQIKDKILQKWSSYERDQLLNFYIIYCLNKNVSHIDLEDLGFKEWFSESMCLKFDEGDEEESVKFCKQCKKQFKRKTNPMALKFRIQYIPERDDDEELKTPKKQDIEKPQMETAVKADTAQKQDKKQEEKNSEGREKQRRNDKKKSYRKQMLTDIKDSIELAKERIYGNKIDISFQFPFERQPLKTKRIVKKGRGVK